MKKSQTSITCIHCKKGNIIKHGKDGNGQQRYKCECGETFNENSLKNFKFHNKKRIATHLLLFGYRSSTVARKLKVSKDDVDSWQHKYLPKLDDLKKDPPGRLTSINMAYNYVVEIENDKGNTKVNKRKPRVPKPKKTTRKK